MIKNINLINYRLFDKLNIEIDKKLVILIGNNASGKTSILESIYLMSTTKSSRTNNFKEIISFEEYNSIIKINFDNNMYEMVLSDQGKYIKFNNIVQKKASDFIGKIKSVMFTPTDIELINGSNKEKRNFLDIQLSILNKEYINVLREYKKIIIERNELLKKFNNSYKEYLLIIDNKLVEYNVYILNERKKIMLDIEKNMNDIIMKITGLNLTVKYYSNVNIDTLRKDINNNLEKDLIYKTTSIGIHKDYYELFLDNKDVKKYSSQGQLKILAISLKIALYYIIEKKFNEKPILLLDEIFSDLDDLKQLEVIKFLLNNEQTFITTTNIDLIPEDIRNLSQIIKIGD
ncbi:MAG: DNA replication/repair protein RecF [Anaeroplasmataceae bacterium]